jgi:NAD(P) transhydrogenase subunit alpha
MMIIGIPRENAPAERRVALVPSLVPPLLKAGHEILVEADAGNAAGYPDGDFAERGARVLPGRSSVFSGADAVFMVQGPMAGAGANETGMMRPGQVVIGFMGALDDPRSAKILAGSGVTAFALELVPRITRAQSMDALSSMANLAGYKSVLLAAHHLPKIFPMMITAAGSMSPARVFVVGAGVAGLQACATARRLGAVVSAYDVRPVVKEQVESVGARFVEFDLDAGDSEDAGGYAKARGEEFYRRQREEMRRVVGANDVVITTAAVPGKKAPILITEKMVQGMARGSVIVDVAAERGGNCELTVPGETVVEHGVTVLGPVNLPATLPYHASQMLGKNITALFSHLTGSEGRIDTASADEILRGTLLCAGGEVVHPLVRGMAGLGPGETSTTDD